MPQFYFKAKPSKGHKKFLVFSYQYDSSSLESNVLEVENGTESWCVVYLGV